MPIASSELILNPDGSVYHLHLRPEQLAPVVILVGDPDRVPLVSQHFDAVDYTVQRREFCTHGGRFAGRPILCISTGIGTDNVDVVLNELDALANVDFTTREVRTDLRQLSLLRLGTSGTFQAQVPVDSFVCSTSAIGLDGLGPFYPFASNELLTTFASTFPAFAKTVYVAQGDDSLARQWQEAGARPGITLTCAGFYGPQRRSIRLPFAGPSLSELGRFRGPDQEKLTNFEMETAGIYGLSQLLGHRALSVSAILANRATGVFSETPGATVERLIALAFAQLKARPELYW